MATLILEDSTLIVRLSPLEKVGAVHGDVRIPLAAIREVRVSDDPFSEVRGMRAPGTGLPGVIALGTFRSRAGKDFDAVYNDMPALVVEVAGGDFRRVVVSTDDAAAEAARISAALAG